MLKESKRLTATLLACLALAGTGRAETISYGDAVTTLARDCKGRANAIQEALATTFSVSPDRLFAVGVGEGYPIDATHPTAADNRRVQFFNLGLFSRKS